MHLRAVAVRVLVVLGGVLAALGLLAGHFNRQLLDGPTFAQNVDEIRRQPDVAASLGRAISTELVLANPDLVALRPLVAAVATSVAGSDVLSAPTQIAATTAHRALTDGDADSAVLRIADAGAVVAAVLNSLDPTGPPVSSNVSVTLASIGSQDFAEATVALASTVDTLAWLLPILAILSFGIAVALAPDRWRAATSMGWALTWAALVLGVGLLVGGFVVRRFDDDTLRGAFGRAAWGAFVRPLWWGVAVMAAIGLAIVMACAANAPQVIDHLARSVSRAALERPRHPLGVVVRAVVAVMLGVAAISDPLGLVESSIALGGVGLVLFAIAEISRLAARGRTANAPGVTAGQASSRRSRRPVVIVVGVAAVLALIAGVIGLARPGRDVAVAAPGSGDGAVCNGHAELCDRAFDDVAYATSHNAMAVAREPGWFLPEQLDPIPVQLDQGVRALQIDVWSGIPAGSVVRTAAGSYEAARTIAERDLGSEVVDAAMRIADSVAGSAQGAEARFLCHGLCETGSTPFLDTLGQLRTWMAANRDEVVTLFIEDHVDAELIAADIEAAGLLPLIYTPAPGAPWPTLGEMIRSGQRLVVMLESGSGGTEAPWLINGFEIVQETPFTFPTVESFSCDPNRGPPGAPLFQLNHWLAGFRSLVTDARQVNASDVLLDRAQQCSAARSQITNLVAVNFVAIGDVFAVVDELNGV